MLPDDPFLFAVASVQQRAMRAQTDHMQLALVKAQRGAVAGRTTGFFFALSTSELTI